MHGTVDGRAPRLRPLLVAWLLGLLLVGSAFAILATAPPASQPAGPVRTLALTVSLNFSPNPVNVNAQTTGSYAIAGGTGPYTIWENNTPPGCGPQSVPFQTPNPSGSFTCTPTATGPFNINVDVEDSTGAHASTQTTLTVNSQSGGGGGGSGTGGNGTGGFSLPSDLVNMVFLVIVLFLVALFAMAAGIIAMAALVSRRLKQLTKAMQPPAAVPSQPRPPAPPKPPEEEL